MKKLVILADRWLLFTTLQMQFLLAFQGEVYFLIWASQQTDAGFSCVYPVIDHEFCCNTLKVPVGLRGNSQVELQTSLTWGCGDGESTPQALTMWWQNKIFCSCLLCRRFMCLSTCWQWNLTIGRAHKNFCSCCKNRYVQPQRFMGF